MKPYKSRDYCKAIGCITQSEIDLAKKHNLSTREERIKNKCHNCHAYMFHQYLKTNKYNIRKGLDYVLILYCTFWLIILVFTVLVIHKL